MTTIDYTGLIDETNEIHWIDEMDEIEDKNGIDESYERPQRDKTNEIICIHT